jgi:DGQHR domain-containing protein
LDRKFVVSHFGEQIDLGACFVGKNLNLQVLRGFARLDQLAAISAPDVFDQQDNPTGTQRALNEVHARECRDYSMGADAAAPEESPRFFPEILLNARDSAVVDLYNLEDPDEPYEFDSFTDSDVPSPVGVRINVAGIEYPKERKSPQISRVDGNHRLWGIDEMLQSQAETTKDSKGNGGGAEPVEFPRVSFSLLLGLSPTQEASLFRDINGEHKGMDVTHLDQIRVRITSPEELRRNPKTRPLWIADQMAGPGKAFGGMVFRGGEREGLRKAGEQRPVKLNSLKTTITQQLAAAPKVSAHFGDDPDTLLALLDNYWKAVRMTFPDAWANRRDYILLQAIGLGAFAKFGGAIIDAAFENAESAQADFERYLKPVKTKVSLLRTDHPGIAGAGGAKYISDLLLKASEPDAVRAEKIRAQLQQPKSINEKLGVEDEPPGESKQKK